MAVGVQSGREIATNAALSFAGNALFPHLAHRARWRSRLGPRGLAIGVLVQMVGLFGIMHWLKPWGERFQAHVEAVRHELREELGREPTDAEYYQRVTGIDSGGG